MIFKDFKDFFDSLNSRVKSIKGGIKRADESYKKYQYEKSPENKRDLIYKIKYFYCDDPIDYDCQGHAYGGESMYGSLKNCYYLSPFKSLLCRKAISRLDKELKNDPQNPIDVNKLVNFYYEYLNENKKSREC